MKYFPLALLILPAFVFSLLPATFSAPAAAPQKTVVTTTAGPLAVLELFTSQGCSSCPPADAILQEMNERAMAGDNIIALSYHVDYWNYLGWKDPFSSPYFSARQTDYTERIGARTYTPQLVINGAEELVGSRKSEVTALVNRALKNAVPTHQPRLITTVNGEAIRVNYTLPEAAPSHRVTALLAQHKATSSVERGENRGRELSHHNVVRAMKHAPATATGNFELQLPKGLSAGDVSVVLLVQEETTHAIVGAARAVLVGK